MGLHQGEGRPVIKSGGPSRVEARLERGEAESVCSCGRNGSGVEERICGMRCKASLIRQGSVKAKRINHEVLLCDTR